MRNTNNDKAIRRPMDLYFVTLGASLFTNLFAYARYVTPIMGGLLFGLEGLLVGTVIGVFCFIVTRHTHKAFGFKPKEINSESEFHGYRSWIMEKKNRAVKGKALDVLLESSSEQTKIRLNRVLSQYTVVTVKEVNNILLLEKQLNPVDAIQSEDVFFRLAMKDSERERLESTQFDRPIWLMALKGLWVKEALIGAALAASMVYLVHLKTKELSKEKLPWLTNEADFVFYSALFVSFLILAVNYFSEVQALRRIKKEKLSLGT